MAAIARRSGWPALKAQDQHWQPPADDAHLTGLEFAEHYLLPLSQSDLLIDGLHEYAEIISIGRDGLLKGELAGEDRAEADFRLLIRSAADGERGRERIATADVVIDTTGTYGHPNWLGRGGMPALGELAAAEHIEYGLPDVLGADRQRYASQRTLLVGAGDSAATTLVALAELAAQATDTWITWVTCAECDAHAPEPLRVRPDDPLADRQRLARQANRLAVDDANHVSLLSGTTVEALSWHADLDAFPSAWPDGMPATLEFDRIIANVGYRGDSQIYSELQVQKLPRHRRPAPIGRAIAGADHDANTPSLGPPALLLPEPDFYILGAKSFGRDPRFLIADGLEQIRELFTIIGDRPDLNLYATMATLH